jgi:hypothetical protein
MNTDDSIDPKSDLELDKVCKRILKRAKMSEACACNYLPAETAYKAKDYDTFMAICRGNYDWLKNRAISCGDNFKLAGKAIRYSTDDAFALFELNDYGHILNFYMTFSSGNKMPNSVSYHTANKYGTYLIFKLCKDGYGVVRVSFDNNLAVETVLNIQPMLEQAVKLINTEFSI